MFVLFELKASFRYADARVWGQCPLPIEICVDKLHPAVHMEQGHIDNMHCIRDVKICTLVGELKKGKHAPS